MTKITATSASEMFLNARFYCIMSVVAAHVFYPGTFAQDFCYRLGTIGVVLFLIMAGYYYRPEKFKNFGCLIKSKAKTICIPWIFFGTVTWLYKILYASGWRTFAGYIKWILGYQSYLYYIPVLLVCFLIFYKSNTVIKIVSIISTIVSVVLTAAGVLEPIVTKIGLTNYLNVFNWVGFFSAGLLLQSINEKKLLNFFFKYRFLTIGVFLTAFVLLMCFKNVNYYYFSYIAIPYEIIGGMFILSLSSWFDIGRTKLFNKVANLSFSVYLIHLPILGVLDNLLGYIELTRLLTPIVVVFASAFVIIIFEWIAKKLKLEKVFRILIGIRDIKNK